MRTQIVIASDTHGYGQFLPLLEKAYPHADVYLHCGDLEEDPHSYPHWIFVAGNNDFYGDDRVMPGARVVTINGIRIFQTHSHRFGYYNREEKIAARARELNCQIAVFGHTHVPMARQIHGVWLINPGSLRFPRDGNSPCYAVIDVDDDGTVHPHLLHEEDWPFASPVKKSRWGW